MGVRCSESGLTNYVQVDAAAKCTSETVFKVGMRGETRHNVHTTSCRTEAKMERGAAVY